MGQSLYATPDISEHVGCQTAWVFVDGVCIEAPVEFHLLLRRNRQGALVRRYAIPQVFNEPYAFVDWRSVSFLSMTPSPRVSTSLKILPLRLPLPLSRLRPRAPLEFVFMSFASAVCLILSRSESAHARFKLSE